MYQRNYFLQNNKIEMYSMHNEEKSVVAEIFIKTLKNKIYKYMASISKIVYIDKLNKIVNKYNNTYKKNTEMKPVDVNPSMYTYFNKENNKESPKFKIGNHVRISKYKNFFAKGIVPNWTEEVFVIKKVKKAFPWTYVIRDLNGEEVVGTFYEKELRKKQSKAV